MKRVLLLLGIVVASIFASYLYFKAHGVTFVTKNHSSQKIYVVGGGEKVRFVGIANKIAVWGDFEGNISLQCNVKKRRHTLKTFYISRGLSQDLEVDVRSCDD